MATNKLTMAEAILIADEILKELDVTDEDTKQDIYISAIEKVSSIAISEQQLRDMLTRELCVNSCAPIVTCVNADDVLCDYIGIIDDIVFLEELSDAINEVLIAKNKRCKNHFISDRNVDIVNKFYGLRGETPLQVLDIAEMYGISQQNVSLIIKESKLYMKHSNVLRAFADECCKNNRSNYLVTKSIL